MLFRRGKGRCRLRQDAPRDHMVDWAVDGLHSDQPPRPEAQDGGGPGLGAAEGHGSGMPDDRPAICGIALALLMMSR
jgi:hypothetical protein